MCTGCNSTVQHSLPSMLGHSQLYPKFCLLCFLVVFKRVKPVLLDIVHF